MNESPNQFGAKHSKQWFSSLVMSLFVNKTSHSPFPGQFSFIDHLRDRWCIWNERHDLLAKTNVGEFRLSFLQICLLLAISYVAMVVITADSSAMSYITCITICKWRLVFFTFWSICTTLKIQFCPILLDMGLHCASVCSSSPFLRSGCLSLWMFLASLGPETWVSLVLNISRSSFWG